MHGSNSMTSLRFAPGSTSDPPIPLSSIQAIEAFKNFGKERSPYRMITHEQYRQLIPVKGKIEVRTT